MLDAWCGMHGVECMALAAWWWCDFEGIQHQRAINLRYDDEHGSASRPPGANQLVRAAQYSVIHLIARASGVSTISGSRGIGISGMHAERSIY
jgi:hypothetical protein